MPPAGLASPEAPSSGDGRKMVRATATRDVSPQCGHGRIEVRGLRMLLALSFGQPSVLCGRCTFGMTLGALSQLTTTTTTTSHSHGDDYCISLHRPVNHHHTTTPPHHGGGGGGGGGDDGNGDDHHDDDGNDGNNAG
ncbi:hypothetical protein P280DRAFT_551373 [Massarina eburnea CBS 473.64]|uniref:Uncharacterized protein n=1 Tax=Massarina eburnea CBS 473.64 TaxID=1395130 RepID=A0A6A6RW77_9PLEO|nr:hypothetical protein P280DRAFT_551373 [Massarina eburnea CBS 473.64]